ncbi:MAG TPA: HAD family hydrolase [Candidatus Bathyarchaeia archaeon]|nr:HAD family hydrolase [Candidatus Bathyarchaeia archaeon]
MRDNEGLGFSKVTFVFLDRDGVLNRKPPAGRFVTCWGEFELLPGVGGAIAVLNRSGHKAIVVTNQRGVALGLYSLEDLAGMHERLQAELAAASAHLDAIYVCPHEAGECNCRKPLTGLFEQAFRDFPAAGAGNSVMVGDSLRDIEAGRRTGMRTVLVDDAASSSADLQRARALADVRVASLAEFVHRYLSAEYHL